MIPRKIKAPSALDWARWWPAPAKLNLFLHILGRREDGYHELETVFHLLDLQDSLHFTPREDGVIIRSTDLPGISANKDLSVRAAHALQDYVLRHKPDTSDYCTAAQGVSIECRKRIPLGAGLGGGSSDAASTLLALNHLWECGLRQSELLHLATKLGADVPVFVAGHSAYARGIGERLEPLELPPCWYLIIKPQVSVYTQKIFSSSGLTRASDTITIHGFLEALKDWPERLPGKNDCQKLVCEEYPKVLQVIDWLNNFGDARLTGTGASVFLPCVDHETAKAVLGQVSLSPYAQEWQVIIAQGLNASPMQAILSDRSWPKEAKKHRVKAS